jgi:hypothetical protein
VHDTIELQCVYNVHEATRRTHRKARDGTVRMYSSAYSSRGWPYGKRTGAPVCWPYVREDEQAQHEDGSGRARRDENPGHAKRKDKVDCS